MDFPPDPAPLRGTDSRGRHTPFLQWELRPSQEISGLSLFTDSPLIPSHGGVESLDAGRVEVSLGVGVSPSPPNRGHLPAFSSFPHSRAAGPRGCGPPEDGVRPAAGPPPPHSLPLDWAAGPAAVGPLSPLSGSFQTGSILWEGNGWRLHVSRSQFCHKVPVSDLALGNDQAMVLRVVNSGAVGLGALCLVHTHTQAWGEARVTLGLVERQIPLCCLRSVPPGEPGAFL